MSSGPRLLVVVLSPATHSNEQVAGRRAIKQEASMAHKTNGFHAKLEKFIAVASDFPAYCFVGTWKRTSAGTHSNFDGCWAT